MQGETVSGGTGPSDDYGGSGYYLFIEASAPAKTGYKAVLKSAEIVGELPIIHTVELQWLEHPWDYENLFETGVVRAIEG